MIKNYPEWLQTFSLTVQDESENELVDPEDVNMPDTFRFEEDLGCVVGSKVLIHGENFKVVRFEVFSDMNVDNMDKETDFRIRLNIIVKKG